MTLGSWHGNGFGLDPRDYLAYSATVPAAGLKVVGAVVTNSGVRKEHTRTKIVRLGRKPWKNCKK